jgi:uncharacterized membrane protein
MDVVKDAPKNWHKELHDNRTLGQKASDLVSKTYGSWAFIITWVCLVTAYISFNALSSRAVRFDGYPFLFLNLALGIPVFFAGMIIMNAQNRQAERDRAKADRDFENDQKALQIIEKLDVLIAGVETDKLDKILVDVESEEKKKGEPE